jgi:hypothetical protein
MLEALIALAALAGNTVVSAATTDAWEAARRKFARLLGCGDAKKELLAETRLEKTRQQLAGVAGQDLEQAQVELARAWQVRMADLLEEDPGAEAELRAVVEEVSGGSMAAVICHIARMSGVLSMSRQVLAASSMDGGSRSSTA